jgi:hypothetical protein
MVSQEVELLTEIRDLLLVIAEPALSQRDANPRNSLRAAVGRGGKRAKAVLLMDGTRSPAVIAKESGMDRGNLSRLVKALAAEKIISPDERHPKLLVRVPSTFFDGDSSNA